MTQNTPYGLFFVSQQQAYNELPFMTQVFCAYADTHLGDILRYFLHCSLDEYQ